MSFHRSSIRRVSGMPGRSVSLIPKKSLTPGNASRTGKFSNRIVINVGGLRYETFKSTLKTIPDTRLSWLTEASAVNGAEYDPDTGEYFFDRHPGVFNMILNYYRTGRLHAPTDVCGPLFEEELVYWGIDEKQIEPCCWMTYRTHRDAQETLKEFDDDDNLSQESEGDHVAELFGLEEAGVPAKSCWESWRPRLWALFDSANSSSAARVLALVSVLFVFLSILTFCLGTHFTFRQTHDHALYPLNSSWSSQMIRSQSSPVTALETLDFVCVCYFTLEFAFRLILCPLKRDFLKGVMNWVDLMSIVPFYVEKLITSVDYSLEHTVGVQILKAVRMVRIFRIFKLTRQISGLKILAHSLKASAKELLLLILFLVISVLIFASLIYYAEAIDEQEMNNFKNIPVGFWWAVVTMTTIGYGDMYPRTGLGYAVGSLCAIAGVLLLALPVPVIVNNFALYYAHSQAKQKLPKKKKRALVGVHDELKNDHIESISEDEVSDDEGRPRKISKSLQRPGGGAERESVTSPTPSDTTVDRKYSDDSALGSMDDPKVAGSPRSGISVIYVDETVWPDCPREVHPQSEPTHADDDSLDHIDTSILNPGISVTYIDDEYTLPVTCINRETTQQLVTDICGDATRNVELLLDVPTKQRHMYEQTNGCVETVKTQSKSTRKPQARKFSAKVAPTETVLSSGQTRHQSTLKSNGVFRQRHQLNYSWPNRNTYDRKIFSVCESPPSVTEESAEESAGQLSKPPTSPGVVMNGGVSHSDRNLKAVTISATDLMDSQIKPNSNGLPTVGT